MSLNSDNYCIEKDLYNYGLDLSEEAFSFFDYIIEKYGEVKFIKNPPTNNYEHLLYTYHDFVYYCFTKSTRSLFSSIKLARNYLEEDVIILMRTVYENYIYISYTMKNQNTIWNDILFKLGLDSGDYYPKTMNTKKDKKYFVINKSTQKSYIYKQISNAYRANHGFNKLDGYIYRKIYKYFSEHIHPNMIASGNYRSRDSYSYQAIPHTVSFQAPFFIIFNCYLLLDAMYYYHKIDKSKWNTVQLSKSDIEIFENMIPKFKKCILKYLDIGKLDMELKNLIYKRII